MKTRVHPEFSMTNANPLSCHEGGRQIRALKNIICIAGRSAMRIIGLPAGRIEAYRE
jgi:hypothetical protein